MWRLQSLWFEIKRITWFRLICFIYGHDIQPLDEAYPYSHSMCFTCYRDGDNIEYEYGLVYWLNNLYSRYVRWTEKSRYADTLWSLEERFQYWFNSKFPEGKLKHWIYLWWEY